jgi:hypothetical protein
MKRFVVAAILVGALVAVVGGTALAAGPITPPAPAAGAYPCGGAGMGGMWGGGRPDWAGEPDEVTTLLGMTDEEIQVERQAGKSLAQIAAAKNVSEDALVSAMVSARKAALDKLVDAGKLTQAQADFMLQNMTSQTKTMVERTGIGPAFGQGGGPGMMGQGMRGGRWNRS